MQRSNPGLHSDQFLQITCPGFRRLRIMLTLIFEAKRIWGLFAPIGPMALPPKGIFKPKSGS